MIMQKRKNMMLIVLIISILLIISSILLIVLYTNTDMFKSNNSLFTKYIKNNFSDINSIISNVNNNELNTKLKESKYKSSTNIKFNYTQNVSSMAGKPHSAFDDFNVTMHGEHDKLNNYMYQDIKLLNNDEEKMQIQYVKDNDTYGVKFPELFKQYILVDNSELKELFENMGYEDVSNIPDNIEISDDILSYLSFSDEEIQQLESKYGDLLSDQIINTKVSKKSNEVIEINKQSVNTKSYSLNLAKEEMNNIFLKILEEVNKDEIILNKLRDIDNVFNNYYPIVQNGEMTSLEDDFVENIDELIRKINETNIGKDETRIIVYESDRNTVKTTIQYTDYKIDIEVLNMVDNKYLKLEIEDSKLSETQTITLEKDNENTNLKIVNNKNGKTETIAINQKVNIDGNKGYKNSICSYEKNDNKLELTTEQKIDFVDELDKTNIEENSIKLNELEEEKLKNVLKQIETSLSEKINTIFTEENKNDFYEMLQSLDIMQQEQKIESEGISETEKNRFNSKFEILQGEKLDSKRIIGLLDTIKDNIVDLKVTSNTQLKVQVDKNERNEEVVTKLNNFVENEDNSSYKYNISLEYDDETGLIKYIVLDIIVE